MTNLFETAEMVGTAKTKAKTDKKHKIQIDGIEMLASIKIVEDSLKAVKTVIDGTAKNQMLEVFVEEGFQLHRKPENFKAEEGEATASAELRKRSTASGLSEMEIALAKEHNIPVETIWDVADTAIINPAYAKDNALLLRVSASLEKVKDLPKDFIQIQKGNPKVVATEESVDAVFKLTSKDLLRKLLSLVTTQAIKPKLNSSNPESIQRAFNRVNEALGQNVSKKPVASKPQFKKGK